MSRFNLSFDGNLGDNPELRVTEQGTSVAKFSVAYDRRRKNDQDEWVTVSTTWFDVTAWGALAEQVADLKRGQRVTVTCRDDLSAWAYTERASGEPAARLQVTAADVSTRLRRSKTGSGRHDIPEDLWPEGAERREPAHAS
ncbi:single-stranded DNA-binding protein [Dactylosporangium darangshiense]|uniref:Single-stranded DNA-binding protein n=1 Tax=Dactylosporangium darangshiense TaxID=579108 RepID=A0ABP8DMQ3_9ACTN